MRNGKFQMYDDDVQHLRVFRAGNHRPSGVSSYAPARFPTRNIVTPIVLMYGDSDSLVDIKQMLRELPEHTTVKRLEGYEHLDILWGENVDKDVIPHVLDALREHCVRPETVQPEGDIKINGLGSRLYLQVAERSGYSTPADSLLD